LRPGGRLFVHEAHPLSDVFSDDDLVVEHSYFEEPEPVAFASGEMYTDNDGGVELSDGPMYAWNHGLGEIVTALIGQGLELQWLREHDWTAFERFPWLIRRDDQHWVLPADRPRVPLTFSLLARRP
jgi:hypothetical protein